MGETEYKGGNESVSKEFTGDQGPVPIPNSSQVSSLSTWLGRQVHAGFSLFSGPVNSEFLSAHEHFNRACIAL